MAEPDSLCRMFASGKPWLTRALYRTSIPLAKPLMKTSRLARSYPFSLSRRSSPRPRSFAATSIR